MCSLYCQDGADGSMLADNLFELKNGCICCTVKDDLVTTLETLLERRNKFDYIIIETTGLANPVGVVLRVSSLCLPFLVHAKLLVVYTCQVPWQMEPGIVYWCAKICFPFPRHGCCLRSAWVGDMRRECQNDLARGSVLSVVRERTYCTSIAMANAIAVESSCRYFKNATGEV